jgi:hypothetical protein
MEDIIKTTESLVGSLRKTAYSTFKADASAASFVRRKARSKTSALPQTSKTALFCVRQTLSFY